MAESTIAACLARYSRLIGISQFFGQYRAHCERRGELPEQKFFVGSYLLREDEVSWCRVLFWLLKPVHGEEAWKLQRALLQRAGIRAAERPMLVERELPSGNGDRLDIVLSNSGGTGTNRWCLVIEAKVNAPQDLRQLERYAQPGARGEFRGGILLALDHGDNHGVHGLPNWKGLKWADLSDILIEIVESCNEKAEAMPLWAHIAVDFATFIKHKCQAWGT